MKAREAERLGVLRPAQSGAEERVYREGWDQFELTEPDALAIVRKEIKKRQDSIESFAKGGRPELAQGAIRGGNLAAYLPKALTPEECSAVRRLSRTPAPLPKRNGRGDETRE